MSSAGVAINPVEDESVLPSFRRPHPRSSDCILVYLAVPGTCAIPMPVLESDSIASVKLRIQSYKGFVMKKQRLVFAGRELARNECLVKDYGVADGNVLHLVIRLSDLSVITVKTVCGKKFKFHIERSRTVAYVKQQIARRGKDHFDLYSQNLLYEGKELDDHWLIQDICEYNGAVIQLFVCESHKARTKPTDKILDLSISAPTPRRNDAGLQTGDLEIARKKTFHGDVWIEPCVVNAKNAFSTTIKVLIASAMAGLEKGNPPVLSSEGTGGAYFMQDASGQEFVAVFKPIDEEPMAKNNPRGLPLSPDGTGLKKGTRVGEGALREVAAYLLDHPVKGRKTSFCGGIGFSGVPPTVMARCLSRSFNHPGGVAGNFKIGSFQMFVKNHGSCEDMGPRDFPVEEVHKIAILDIRLANADRHAGNILLCKDGEEGRITLVPIDHGYCLPENFEDCTFEWLYWPQARAPFSATAVEYIRSLDAEEDIALLGIYGWDLPPNCRRTLRISTMLLKKGADRGLTPHAVGRIMCREALRKESEIERMIRQAADAVLPAAGEAALMESVSRAMDELAP